LYKPLGGNKVGILLNFRNILIVFVVSGLWHGAKWTFIVWGLVHGIALISERLSGFFYQKINKKPLPFLGWLWTMFIVMGSWIFFRAENLKQAREIIKGIIQKPFYGLEIFWNNGGIWEEASFHKQLSGIWAGQLYILVGCTLLMFFLELLHAKKDMYKLLSALPWALQCLIYSILVWVIVLLGTFDNNMEFIYFQF
jgi:hypothetical protein